MCPHWRLHDRKKKLKLNGLLQRDVTNAPEKRKTTDSSKILCLKAINSQWLTFYMIIIFIISFDDSFCRLMRIVLYGAVRCDAVPCILQIVIDNHYNDYIDYDYFKCCWGCHCHCRRLMSGGSTFKRQFPCNITCRYVHGGGYDDDGNINADHHGNHIRVMKPRHQWTCTHHCHQLLSSSMGLHTAVKSSIVLRFMH